MRTEVTSSLKIKDSETNGVQFKYYWITLLFFLYNIGCYKPSLPFHLKIRSEINFAMCQNELHVIWLDST